MGRVEVKPKAVFIVLKISAEIAPDIYMLSAIVGIGMSLTSLTQVNGKTSCDCGVTKSEPVVAVQGLLAGVVREGVYEEGTAEPGPKE